MQPAFTVWWRNGRICEELKLKAKEKWIFVDKKSVERSIKQSGEADRNRCMTCGRGGKYLKMPGKCTGPKFLSKKAFRKWRRRHLGGQDRQREEFAQWARELGASAADVEVWAQGLRRFTQAAELRAKAAQRGFAKRSREELAYFLSERRRDSQATGRSSGGTCSDVPPPPQPGGRRWPGGRGKKKATRGTAAVRADRDKREREKAVAKLVDLLDFLDLPIAVRARQYHDKTVHLRRGARGLRVSTLRMRIRAWTKLQTWLEATVGRSWPHSVDDVLGYLECLASGGKSAGIAAGSPGRALHGGRWGGAHRGLHRPLHSLGQLPARTRFRGTRGPRRGRAKAPMIPVMVLFALELVVLDTVRFLYVRGFAWVKLLKFWASLRYDDLQWLAPASTVLTAAGLHATLPRTETSGPGRRAATLTATISSDAWLVSPRWLSKGFAIWKHFETDRDYLLPCPTPDLQGVRDCYASCNDAAALSQALHNELRWPKVCPERGWQGSAGEALLCQGAGRFWTEHSERNGLTSMGAALGFGEAQRKHLGRWTTDFSEGYVRTTTAIVHEIQGKCARALREGAGQADFLAEFELLADLDRFLEAKGYTSEAREHQKERLQFFKDREGFPPGSSEAAGDGQAAEVSKVDAEILLEELPPLPGHYFIALTRRGRTRRLHCFGSCPTAPGTNATAGRTTVRTFRHPRSTRLCQKFWPTGQAGPKASSASSRSSSSSGTRSSSSSESI